MSMNPFLRSSARPTAPRNVAPFAAPWVAAVSAILVGLLAATPATAGSLDPPAPPAPTMKTLDEIKPGVPVLAADIPLTITSPGYYYLAEDVAWSGSGIPILIQADGVTFDLGGFTLQSTSTLDDVLHIAGPCSQKGLTVRNGRILGGRNGLSAAPPNPCVISITDLAVSGSTESGVFLVNAGPTAIRDGSVSGAGTVAIFADGGGGPVTVSDMQLSGAAGAVIVNGATARLSENIMFPSSPCVTALELTAADGSLIAGNSILVPPDPCQPAVSVLDSDGVFLSGNTVRSGGGTDPASHGILVDLASSGAVLRQNVVTGFGGDGMRIEGSGILAGGNMLGSNGGAGIFVAGDDIVLEGNRCATNTGAGVWFDNSSGHVYRDNILTGNAGGGVAGPGSPDVTDAGGNVP